MILAGRTPVPDLAAVRLFEAVELCETGLPEIALRTFESIARCATSVERRLEALCHAAEAVLESAGPAAAAAYVSEARTVLERSGDCLDPGAINYPRDAVDFADWLVRWRSGSSSGFASPPPIVLAVDTNAANDPDERRRALFVRASAEYAMQRWEIGDRWGRAIVRRALGVVRTLGMARKREHLAIMRAEAQLAALCSPPGAARDRFLLIEGLATRFGYRRTLLAAHAERIVCDVATGASPRRAVGEGLRAFGAVEQRTMSWTFAWTARLVAQHEASSARALAAARRTESLVSGRTAQALMARCVRAACALRCGELSTGWDLARGVATDVMTVGNNRVLGATYCYLAEIALARRRFSEAQRHIARALELLEHHGAYESFRRATAIGRVLGVA